jgi:hypothetical protein
MKDHYRDTPVRKQTAPPTHRSADHRMSSETGTISKPSLR